MQYARSIPELAALMADADYVDARTAVSDKALRPFVAACLSYMPGWMVLLYKVRALFVRLLGMRQNGYPGDTAVGGDDISMTPGDRVGFLTVTMARDGEYWVGEATEKHLSGYLVTAAEELGDGRRRYHALTVVKFRHWTGPVYFNVIRPFHHIVVRAMMAHAA